MDAVSRALIAIESCTSVDQVAVAQRYMSLAMRRHNKDWAPRKVWMFAFLLRTKARTKRRRLFDSTATAVAA